MTTAAVGGAGPKVAHWICRIAFSLEGVLVVTIQSRHSEQLAGESSTKRLTISPRTGSWICVSVTRFMQAPVYIQAAW
jgi:hypothetical protein